MKLYKASIVAFLLGMLWASVCSAQITASGSVASVLSSSDTWYRDRETFGVRYRVKLAGPIGLQVGALLAAENGLFPSKSGATTRHWAAALEYRGRFTLSAIYGRLVEQRTDERLHVYTPDIAYYTFVAGGLMYAPSPKASVGVEVLLWNIKQVAIQANAVILRLHTEPLDCIVRVMTPGSDEPQAHTFVAPSCILRPLYPAKAPWKWIGIEAGWRPVLDYDINASVSLRHLSAGIYWRTP